jgi:hypothetical protein
LDLFEDKSFSKLYKNLGDEHKLKTKPRDYPLAHPRIEWLKLTGFYVSRPIPKKELFSASFAEILIRDWKEAMRFNNLLDDWIQRSPGQASQKTSEKPSFGLHAYDWDD